MSRTSTLHTERANPSKLRVLVVEDESGPGNLMSTVMANSGYRVECLDDVTEAIRHLRESRHQHAVLLVSSDMPGATAELFAEAREAAPGIVVIGAGNPDADAAAGLDLVIPPPATAGAVREAIERCLERLRDADRDRESEAGFSGEHLIGRWRPDAASFFQRVALSDIPVLLQGETGTGKEVLARYLHGLSPRSGKPFLKVNCAALPSELVESELFGYERGAFTGAFKTNPGKFEMAEGGTILLDEIGDMDFKLQAKLLQVLQDHEFVRLGSSEPRRVNVRVMAATHCNLEKAIAENRFREDLYYRLNVVAIEVPSLRERKNEIIPLTYHFLRKHCPDGVELEITGKLREVLLWHDWPGNIRELENVIRRLVVLGDPEASAEEIRTRARRRAKAAAPKQPNRSNQVVEPVESAPEPDTEPKRWAAWGGTHSEAAAAAPAVARSREHAAEVPVRLSPPPAHPVQPRAAAPAAWPAPGGVDQIRRTAEAEAILAALNATLWNRRRAAALLQLEYKALLYRIKKLGITARAKSSHV